jgi:hypothetical protein
MYRSHWLEASKLHAFEITILLFYFGVQREHGMNSNAQTTFTKYQQYSK